MHCERKDRKNNPKQNELSTDVTVSPLCPSKTARFVERTGE
jgi:hypothetical protein